MSSSANVQPAVVPRYPRVGRWLLTLAAPLVAGLVNAMGFIELGGFTSHMTGNSTLLGDELASGDGLGAALALAVLATFFSGSTVAAAFISRGRARRGRLVMPLLWELIAIAAFALLRDYHAMEWRNLSLKLLLCFAMGLQNAMFTMVSTGLVRTTHLTGLLTDTGVEIGKALTSYWRRSIPSTANFNKVRLQGGVFMSFVLGAYLGPQLYTFYGNEAFILPCGVLMVLLIFDIRVGFYQEGSLLAGA